MRRGRRPLGCDTGIFCVYCIFGNAYSESSKLCAFRVKFEGVEVVEKRVVIGRMPKWGRTQQPLVPRVVLK